MRLILFLTIVIVIFSGCDNSSNKSNNSKSESNNIHSLDPTPVLIKLSMDPSFFDRVIGSLNTPGSARMLALNSEETIAYIADGDSGIQVIDVSDPSKLKLIGSLDIQDFASAIVLNKESNIAYVGSEKTGLHIIDVSNPDEPILISSTKTENGIHGLAINTESDIVFLAESFDGIRIIDVSNSKIPTEVSVYKNHGQAMDVALNDSGTVLYVAGGNSGLEIIDISNVEEPKNISRFKQAVHSYNQGQVLEHYFSTNVAISKSGSEAYLTHNNKRTHVINIKNLESPRFINTLYTINNILGAVNADETIAYLSMHYLGFKTIDLTEVE